MPALRQRDASAGLRLVGLLGEGECYEAQWGIRGCIKYVDPAEAAIQMLNLKRADVPMCRCADVPMC